MKNKTTIALFCMIIYLPIFQMITGVLPEVSIHENRIPAKKPVLNESKDFNCYLFSFDSYFKDNFGMRSYLVKLELSFNYLVFNSSKIKDVQIGKNGWLYYTPEKNDGVTLEDFTGKVNFSAEEIGIIKSKLHSLKNLLESKKIRFLFFITPNKSSVYSEFLPDEILANKSNYTRIDQIQKVLTEEKINFIDLKDILIKKKATESFPIYYKTDSHWNYYGAYIGYNEIISKLNLPNRNYIFNKNFHPGGDLARMISVDGLVLDTEMKAERLLDPEKVCTHDYGKDSFVCTGKKDGARLLMFRDSFSIWLVPFLIPDFSRSIFLWGTANIDLSLIEKEKPDIVIIQMVERHSVNLPFLFK